MVHVEPAWVNITSANTADPVVKLKQDKRVHVFCQDAPAGSPACLAYNTPAFALALRVRSSPALMRSEVLAAICFSPRLPRSACARHISRVTCACGCFVAVLAFVLKPIWCARRSIRVKLTTRLLLLTRRTALHDYAPTPSSR